MPQTELRHPLRARAHLAMTVARDAQEVLEAQRLRYMVFKEEMGARMPDCSDGVDRDPYDAHCEHLLVRDTGTGRVVGTYRIPPRADGRETENKRPAAACARALKCR